MARAKKKPEGARLEIQERYVVRLTSDTDRFTVDELLAFFQACNDEGISNDAGMTVNRGVYYVNGDPAYFYTLSFVDETITEGVTA